jgi:uncharacterized membrane protein YadS
MSTSPSPSPLPPAASGDKISEKASPTVTTQGSFQKKLLDVTPGVLLSAAVMHTAMTGADALSTHLDLPIGGVPAAILLGVAVANQPFVALGDKLAPGLKYASTTLLRAGK